MKKLKFKIKYFIDQSASWIWNLNFKQFLKSFAYFILFHNFIFITGILQFSSATNYISHF